MTAIETNFVQYLAAKKKIDDRALNRHVLDQLTARLPTQNLQSPLRVLELGAGIGTMVERLFGWDLITCADYTAVDADPKNIGEAHNRLNHWVQQNQFAIKWHDPATATVATSSGQLAITYENSDVYDFLEQSIDQKQWDLGLAHAFMDIVDAAEVVSLFCRLIKPGGLLYLSLNYDGETILLPTIDPELDERILQLYNRSMDERIVKGKKTGNSKTGRYLLFQLLNTGAQIVSAGSSDWVVFPGPRGYTQDEAYFLHFIVRTIYLQLKSHPTLDQEQLKSWAHQRHAQIEKGQLIFIAKHMDVLAGIPNE